MEASSERAMAAKELEVQRLQRSIDNMKRELFIAQQHAKTCEQLLRMEQKYSSSEPAASHVSHSDKEARRIRAEEVETLYSWKQKHEKLRITMAQQKTEIEKLKDERTILTRIRYAVGENLDRHTQQTLVNRKPNWNDYLDAFACMLIRESSSEAWCAHFASYVEPDDHGQEVPAFPRPSDTTDADYIRMCLADMQSSGRQWDEEEGA